MKLKTCAAHARMNARMRLVILLPILFSLFGCSKAAQQDGNAPQTVQVETVQKTGPQAQVLTASLEPYAQSQLSFKSGGLVDWILQTGLGSDRHTLSPGDTVRRGHVLAHVRLLDYEQKLAQARAGLASAVALERSAEASRTQATLDEQRSKTLYGSGALTKPDMDRSQANYDSASAAVQQAKAGVTGAASQLAQARTALQDASIAAPYDGTVLNRSIELGNLVSAGQPAFTFLDTSRVKAIFSVGSSLLPDLRKGQSIPVAVDGLDRPVMGVVTSIAPAADPKTRVFEVEVTIANPGRQLRPGMTGNLSPGSGIAQQPTLAVPMNAVVKAPAGKGEFAVFTLNGSREETFARLVPVAVGEAVGNSVVIRSGLYEGQKVITSGAPLLRDGQLVRVTP